MRKIRAKELYISLFVLALIFALIIGVDEIRSFILGFLLRMFLFIKSNIIIMLTSLFLVKGKFVWLVFLKKITLLSVTGLGKRYLTEKVFIHHIKVHLIEPLRDDIKHLVEYTKKHFGSFPMVKKLIALVAFLGSISYIAKSMGIFLAIKVILGKIWSFLLAFFIKIGGGILYFFTDYLWNSWVTPIIEILIFSWFFSLMEKVPALNRILKRVYALFYKFFVQFELILEKIFHIPLRAFMRLLVYRIRRLIRKFVKIKHKSPYQKLKESHKLFPPLYIELKKRRVTKKENIKKVYKNSIVRLKERRKSRLSKNSLYGLL